MKCLTNAKGQTVKKLRLFLTFSQIKSERIVTDFVSTVGEKVQPDPHLRQETLIRCSDFARNMVLHYKEKFWFYSRRHRVRDLGHFMKYCDKFM